VIAELEDIFLEGYFHLQTTRSNNLHNYLKQEGKAYSSGLKKYNSIYSAFFLA